MADRSQNSTDLSVYISGGLHKLITLPTVLLAKTNSVMFLEIFTKLKVIFQSLTLENVRYVISLQCNYQKRQFKYT